MNEQNPSFWKTLSNVGAAITFCAFVPFLCYIPCLIIYLLLADSRYLRVITYGCVALPPALLIGLVLLRNKKKFMKCWTAALAVLLLAAGINAAYIRHDDSITIDTAPSIDVARYLPFQENSDIATLDRKASLSLSGELPIVDGAAAVFPLYSAFVNATYPETTELYDGVFEYHNTVGGYRCLADRNSDIFFGAYPSEDQIEYAREQGTEFVYTPIGKEAFVFFVHKDNPVDNLTSEQIRMIYTGQITNWKQLGGNNEPIFAYQRNEGSGSQSMFLRFMGDQVPMEPSTETQVGGMLDIIETVADYRNKDGSIGFSFRYYMEGIIKNPDVKLLSVDGVAPTVENIQSGAYPITATLYAVTWKGNNNQNVTRLLNWILSPEGQELVEKTGYVPIG